MATITLTIKDSIVAEATNALAIRGGWTENVTDETGATVPNPVTKAAAAKARLLALARNDLVEYRNQQALTGVSSDNEL